MSGLKGIHHVAYRCKDAKQTVEFYHDLLGMEYTTAFARMRDVDGAERSFRVRAFFYSMAGCAVLATMVAMYLQDTRGIGGLGMLGVIALGAFAGAALGAGVLLVSTLGSRGFVSMVTAGAGMPSADTLSYQQSLVARGRFAEAADAYRAHLTEHPTDHDARLALASLCAGPLDDASAAERLYLDVRAGLPSLQQEWQVSEALIELYRKTGQRGREMTELSRAADRYRGTAVGGTLSDTCRWPT